ncbi:hypothetical protein [Actinomadura sp. NBRC 104425]|uniref:hypothetical protein n=1 Tax=Actinomadura sp. NBRC 104425 TaxID=3032204 RepID=UPI00255419A7|nr:hypothetical protein [Actinomadura sp. NBRC 104425]
MATSRPPSDLGAAGRALWRRIGEALADMPDGPLQLDPWEVELVAEVCRAVDRMAALRDRMAAAEEAGDDARWLRLVQEERQQRAILGRVVAASGLPTGLVGGDTPAGLSPRSRRAQRAARARWGRAS